MVRLKSRYLLVNFFYPSKSTPSNKLITPIPSPSSAVSSFSPVIQFRAPTPDAFTAQVLSRLIRDTTAALFGDYGLGLVSSTLQVKYFSPATSTAIIRVARDHYRLVWAALTTITHLPKPLENERCVMQVVHVSGTIRHAEEEAIRRAKEVVTRAKAGVGPELDALMKPPQETNTIMMDANESEGHLEDDEDDEDSGDDG